MLKIVSSPASLITLFWWGGRVGGDKGDVEIPSLASGDIIRPK